MPRALLLLLPLLTAHFVTTAEVFVIADTANQTVTIAENAKETIAEANNITLANGTLADSDLVNGTLADSDGDDHEPVVRKKRTFGDVVFRGLADVLGYSVARKPPQIQFPPPLAPVPGIDEPLQVNIPVAFVPVAAAAAAVAPAPAPAQAAPPCGAARAAPQPCRAQAPPPPPPPKPRPPPPCPKPRAIPRPKPRPAPRPAPPPPPPCGAPRANPVTPSPCAPPPPPPPPPKADPNLETISSNFRLDFNFNRAPASAPAAEATVEEEQVVEQEQEQINPVAIQPRAAQLPVEPPRTPRVYLDAFVVRNGVAQKVHTVDAKNINQPQADDDYLAYDEQQQQQQPQQDDDYDYGEDSQGRAKAVREFGNAVDRFWEQKQKKPRRKIPANDYRNVHFGDRDLANQLRRRNDEQLQSLQRERPHSNRIPLPETDEYDEITTTTQDPRRRLKPRVLPPTEKNPNEIDTITVRVPPIYKEKHPKKLHRGRPDRDEERDYVPDYEEREYLSDSETDNTEEIPQTEKPKRKRRRKLKRKTRSAPYEAYTAGDYDYYGNKLPITNEEKYFRGLTIPPPTKDADVIRVEESKDGNGHFLDDHERLRDDSERIRSRRRKNRKDKERTDESERSDEKERSRVDTERAGEKERSDEKERTDKLSPNARVRATGYRNNFVRATNVQVDNPSPVVSNVKKKDKKADKA